MAVPTRLPLKRVPAHVPGTASGFQVHELKKSASVVAVVDVVVVAVAAVDGCGPAGGTHPRPGVGRHLVGTCTGAGAQLSGNKTRGGGLAGSVCGLQVGSASRTHTIGPRARRAISGWGGVTGV